MITKVLFFKVVEKPDKMLTILQDNVGWYYIARLPLDRDNIWPSIEMIEEHLEVHLEPYFEKVL